MTFRPELGVRVASANGGFSALRTFCLVLLSVMCLYIIVTLWVPRRGHGPARPIAALTQLHSFAVQLRAFRDDTSFNPPGMNGLQDLVRQPAGVTNWHGPYAHDIPKDPWGREYVYACPGEHTKSGYPYDLLSLGPVGESNWIANWTQAALKP
jgi:general secretion pathway protein G